MDIEEKVFPCLNCGSDTGCPNKLICDKCRVLRRQKPTQVRVQKVIEKKGRLRKS